MKILSFMESNTFALAYGIIAPFIIGFQTARYGFHLVMIIILLLSGLLFFFGTYDYFREHIMKTG